MKELNNKGIGTRPFFYPMHQQPVFKKMELFVGEEFPNSEKLYERGYILKTSKNVSLVVIPLIT